MLGATFNFTLLDAASQTRTKDDFFKQYGKKYNLADANAVTDAVMADIINKDFIQRTVNNIDESNHVKFSPIDLT